MLRRVTELNANANRATASVVVDLTAVPNARYFYQSPSVVDGIHDPVIAHTYALMILAALELLAAGRPRVRAVLAARCKHGL